MAGAEVDSEGQVSDSGTRIGADFIEYIRGVLVLCRQWIDGWPGLEGASPLALSLIATRISRSALAPGFPGNSE